MSMYDACRYESNISPGLSECRDIEEVYTFGKQVGEGHYGRVVSAIDSRSGVKVAIKIINKKKNDALHAQKVRDEISIQARVSRHANVVRLIETFEDQKCYYLVMEFCDGGDLLNAIIEHGALSEHRAATALRQLAAAISFLHESGITHRDLKPENLLLAADGTLRLADFGLSAAQTSKMVKVCGTWAYCAPEVVRQQTYDASVDVWSLGVIMFIMLGGYNPFDMYGKLSDAQLVANVISCNYSFHDRVWDSVSHEAKSLIRRLLVPDPAKRLPLADFLNSPWLMQTAVHSETGAGAGPPPGVHMDSSSLRSCSSQIGSPISDVLMLPSIRSPILDVFWSKPSNEPKPSSLQTKPSTHAPLASKTPPTLALSISDCSCIGSPSLHALCSSFFATPPFFMSPDMPVSPLPKKQAPSPPSSKKRVTFNFKPFNQFIDYTTTAGGCGEGFFGSAFRWVM